MQPFSYCLLRYLHDSSLGEAVNVGVLIYAPDANWVRFVASRRTKALSTLFRGFNRSEFIGFVSRLETSVERFGDALTNSQNGLFLMDKKPKDAGELARWLLPDNDLCFQFSEVRAGLTRDPLVTTQQIAERVLVEPRPAVTTRLRRPNDEVWASFQEAFVEQGIERYLTPHTVETSEFALPFDHAYKNGLWHAIEAISFDYARPDEIRDHAMLWYSYGAALSESEEFASLTLLLGAPRQPEHQKAYEQAKKWLAKMPVAARLVEEPQAERFAQELAQKMKSEGVIQETDVPTES